jgi:hypothetical protein
MAFAELFAANPSLSFLTNVIGTIGIRTIKPERPGRAASLIC